MPDYDGDFQDGVEPEDVDAQDWEDTIYDAGRAESSEDDEDELYRKHQEALEKSLRKRRSSSSRKKADYRRRLPRGFIKNFDRG